MRLSMYPKLAWSGMWKNKKLYLPYIMTSVGMVAMYYIIASLSRAPGLRNVMGGAALESILIMGSNIIAIFSAIFLFYTSSFLMRRRRKEFGLYNILGMGKRHIGVIMMFETLYSAVLSVVLGTLLGISLSKLAELILLKLLRAEIGYEITISPAAILILIPVFAVIFVIILLSSLMRLRLSSPIELLRGESAGERPPKANPVIAILGAGLLIGAYFIAVTTKNPLMALTLFFFAVLMVIVGTYALFVAGSVFICRALQKNKRFYYNRDNFISVSSMAFRMKRNGAGLASICILLTMVLVTMTGSAGLYAGEEDIIRRQFPREIMGNASVDNLADFKNDENMKAFRADIEDKMIRSGGSFEDGFFCRMISMSSVIEDGAIISVNDSMRPDEALLAEVFSLYLVPLRDYNEMIGGTYTLEEDEALVYTIRYKYEKETAKVKGVGNYRIKARVDEFIEADKMMSSAITPSVVLIVSDIHEEMEAIASNSNRKYFFGYNVGNNSGTKIKEALLDIEINDENGNNVYPGMSFLSVRSRYDDRQDFFVMFGGIFFLGIMLSAVFLLSAVLIIYYKQISEGYEDEKRFDIMKKVGLTDSDIMRNINSQMKTVFILPIVAAAMHLCFSLPMLVRLLRMFGLMNVRLIASTALICVVIITAIYMIVYKLTAGTYYRIVKGG